MGHSIAISAGEASGDLNGAYLAAELTKLRGDLSIWGAGGPRMRGAGVEIAVDMAGSGTIGIAESFRAAPRILLSYFRLRRELLRRKPDLLIPIDFGAFNVRVAQVARKSGIEVVYYFPPSSWRRRPRNAARLLACGGKVVTPFPWSAELLSSEGVDARFVGHPLVDIARPSMAREDFLSGLGLSTLLPTIGLLPGSRTHELGEHLLPMLECADIISRDLGGAQFVIGAAWGAEDIQRRVAAAALGKQDFPVVKVVQGQTYDCIAHSDLLITKSGTATLEAAIIGTPMVIVYRGTAIMRLEFMFRKSVLEGHIGMPNIVAGRGICPELINQDVTADRLASVALGLLRDAQGLARMRSELAGVRSQLGDPGAVGRVARTVLEMGGLG